MWKNGLTKSSQAKLIPEVVGHIPSKISGSYGTSSPTVKVWKQVICLLYQNRLLFRVEDWKLRLKQILL